MIPTITVGQMREVDRLMVEDMRIELIQMMENAGRCLAQHVRSELGGDVRRRRVAVLAGRGGNGGGGLVAARRLAIWGADVTVLLARKRGRYRVSPATSSGSSSESAFPSRARRTRPPPTWSRPSTWSTRSSATASRARPAGRSPA